MNLNKKGHVALAITAGTFALSFLPTIAIQTNPLTAVALVAFSAIGGLAPDLDHKTSTSSQLIQFSAKKRQLFKSFSLTTGSLGLLFYVLQFLHVQMGNSLLASAPVWIIAAAIFGVLARMRSIVLIGIGLLLMVGFAVHHWHWISIFAGVSFLAMPLVKHRGVIHTPEFAAVLSLGLYSFALQQPDIIHAVAIGFVTGWWAHLAGDIFGSEGIHSLFVPKLRVALHLFNNGGSVERMIARGCWLLSIFMWILLVANKQPLALITTVVPINF